MLHTFWDFLWSAIVAFAFIAYLLILFNIIGDLFWRDHQTSGRIKALWVVCLILFPYLTALIYLITRGQSMTVRARDAAGPSPAQEIAHAKELLDAGTITPDEFDALKAKALG
ncbi:membrane protein [Mycobacterium sp. MFM001]|uniref:SHOCT domain-containing protein n=1 Tax=Mycobacterium sp. MFM001 TaxID=2049453 RepID=UPI000DA51404|nr:SHOCT domain-containing protein [Mycobacterium sp. MFM001]GBE68017.1 membrane protein [Mycobacterium sp. MFM001]